MTQTVGDQDRAGVKERGDQAPALPGAEMHTAGQRQESHARKTEECGQDSLRLGKASRPDSLEQRHKHDRRVHKERSGSGRRAFQAVQLGCHHEKKHPAHDDARQKRFPVQLLQPREKQRREQNKA